ncbi:SPOR domain-containing protein [Legionella waltersii]|uniref:Sporulation domain-containing protein n=1 Tax=Legionella waltersii TaxID=66969 RepID=A0A0W1AN63_9GAMM|nr:SPOR domain-containing protein [Legionella waltersii]KTD82627.1 Sporulation domain-containing protein [Legionella waltersii]SNV07958.1 Sporulation domain-containing protein [Legionella waltersii]
MARDYGNRRPAKKNSAPNQLLVIVVTFLLGYFTATIMDVQKVSQWINKEILADNEPVKQPIKTAEQKPQVPPKPKFEFYTLLANEKSGSQAGNHQENTQTSAQTSAKGPEQVASKSINDVVSNSVRSSVQVAEGKPVDNHQPSNKTSSYLVQVASFKTRHDADNMKAKLILKGFDVNVVQASQAQGSWFRVVVGPYPDKTSAQLAQINLAKNERLNGMLRAVGG